MKDRKIRVVSVILMMICLFLFPVSVKAATKKQETIKVGFYPVVNYQEVKEDGTYSGFSYDYFMQIQKYARWNYDFVQASYADCMKMLATGEIDVMSGVGKTSQREQAMIFSRYSISNSQNRLFAKSDNKDLYYESYDTFDGCKVAIQQGMVTKDLEEYAKVHGFKISIQTYPSIADMEKALSSGKVDMICAASISNGNHTKIVAKLDKQPLYYVTTKNRPDISAKLDDALSKINDSNPEFFTNLSQKYMINGTNAAPTFTRKEQEYIDSKPKNYVIVNANWAPITWYDKKTKSYKGIFIDVLKKIETYSGLDFIICTENEFNQKAKKDPDMLNHVVAILADDNSWAEQQNVMLSNHVVDSSVVRVTKRSIHQATAKKGETIALPKKFYIGYVMRDEMKGKKVTYYDTVKDCLDAVNARKADATYINELVSTYYLSMLEYGDLYATANSGYFENLAFAVNKESEEPVLSILDKSLLCLGSNDIEQIVVQNSIAEERISLKGLYYSNPTTMILIVVGIAVFVFGTFFSIYTMKARKKRAELELRRESETSTARTEFFMMISHELRTPLNAIVGYLNLVAEQIKKKGWDLEYIRRSQNAAAQLTRISEDMLDYTRIASDTVELREELFDLKEVIINADQNISLKATQKGQKYKFTIHDISHEYVVGDKFRIEQIIQNILSNGVKFTEAGGTVEADVRERECEDGDVEVIFSCKDTGKGMEPEFLEKLCAPFNQSDKSYSRTHGGLGLGLYLTKYFVNAMNGTIEVESEVGKGSSFVITLPLKRPNSEQILSNHVDCSHVRAMIGAKNKEDAKQLSDLLSRLKIKSNIITEEEKVTKRILSRMGGDYAYSLCILDDTMLDVDATLIDEISTIESAPQIFVLTSNPEKVNELSLNRKVCQVLYKPIFQSVLFDAVMNTFGEYDVESIEGVLDDFTGIHAMIVEDNQTNADILTRILEKVNMTVTVCENGKIALDRFKEDEKDTYQIIFMDIQMPVMNGYAATEAIRQVINKNGHLIPIVAVSANAFPEDVRRSLEVGMNEHLSKPLSAAKMYEVTKRYCGDVIQN